MRSDFFLERRLVVKPPPGIDEFFPIQDPRSEDAPSIVSTRADQAVCVEAVAGTLRAAKGGLTQAEWLQAAPWTGRREGHLNSFNQTTVGRPATLVNGDGNHATRGDSARFFALSPRRVRMPIRHGNYA